MSLLKKLFSLLFNFGSIIPPKSDVIGYKTTFLNNVFFFAGVVALGMSFIRWHHDRTLAFLDFSFSVICFALLTALNKSRVNVELLSSIALSLCALLFFSIYFLAESNPTRSGLLFLLLSSAFFLKGKRAGLIYLGAIVTLALINHYFAFFDTNYTHIDMLTLCLYLIAQYFIINNYELIKESQNNRLLELNASLEELIHDRTQELAKANIALEQERLRLKELSDTDRLTGLDNRYKFEETFISERNSQNRSNLDASVIMIDLDNFKGINDTYGHMVGDDVLKQVAAVIKASIRSNDTAARWGGDEFIIFTPRTKLEQAAHLAEKIRQQINQLSIPQVGSITISLGLTELKAQDTLLSFIQRADRALYLAKDKGRNNLQTITED